MRKRNFEKSKKEKWTIFLTSALVVSACAITGLYVNRMERVKNDGYVVDLSELEPGQTESGLNLPLEESIRDAGSEILSEMENEAASETVGSNSVLNQPKQTQKLPEQEIIADKSATVGELEAKKSEINKAAPNQKKEAVASKPEQNETPIQQTAPLQFGIDDEMMWPLNGDVILNYSMDKTVYFATLDQYKYNPAIYINGQAGDTISAAARGEVLEVGADEELGQFIKMNLGDGYEATYGEVENITVSKGDIVVKGQVIAALAQPTKYYSIEGPNLYFAVQKDGTSLNPMDYLAGGAE